MCVQILGNTPSRACFTIKSDEPYSGKCLEFSKPQILIISNHALENKINAIIEKYVLKFNDRFDSDHLQSDTWYQSDHMTIVWDHSALWLPRNRLRCIITDPKSVQKFYINLQYIFFWKRKGTEMYISWKHNIFDIHLGPKHLRCLYRREDGTLWMNFAVMGNSLCIHACVPVLALENLQKFIKQIVFIHVHFSYINIWYLVQALLLELSIEQFGSDVKTLVLTKSNTNQLVNKCSGMTLQ